MYQPAWNNNAYGSWDPKRMIDQCYRPNAELMKKIGVKINMNITQTMYEFFKQNNALDVLELYREMGAQIEFVGSTAHHILTIEKYLSVLALEIQEQNMFIDHYFGQSPTSFFPPEMAIDEHTSKIVAEAGFKGMIVSGGNPNFQSYETTGIFESNGIKVFPHNNLLSAQFAFPVNGFSSDHDLNLVVEKLEQYEEPVLFAFDHESFGGYHNPHVLEMKKRFFEIAKEKGWNFVHFSELLNKKAYGKVELKQTTWVGNYSKWEKTPERVVAIDTALSNITMNNQKYIRKFILPSCHLHIDYATEKFWEYVGELNNE